MGIPMFTPEPRGQPPPGNMSISSNADKCMLSQALASTDHSWATGEPAKMTGAGTTLLCGQLLLTGFRKCLVTEQGRFLRVF